MWHIRRMTGLQGKVKNNFPTTASHSVAMYWYVAVAFLAGLGLLGKAQLLARFIHLPLWLVVPLVGLSPAMSLFWPLAYRWRAVLGPTVGLSLAMSFLFIFPRVQDLHKVGRGSDQPDCILVASHRIENGLWPYVASEMSSGNPLSCGPGWVILQAPAVDLLNYSWNLILCWAMCIAVLGYRWGWQRTAALLTLLGLSVGTWLCAANGSDFLSFGIVLVTFWMAVEPGTQRRGWLLTSVLTILLGLLVQFRIPTILIPAFSLRRFGRLPSITAFALALVSVALFMVWNPWAFIHEGPLHLGVKLLRTAVLSDHAAVAVVEVVVVAVAGFLLTALFVRRSDSGYSLLVFLALVFLLPAMQNLLIEYKQRGSILNGFQFWEGGMWIETLVPLAAALLVDKILPASVRATSPGVTVVEQETVTEVW
jgi:hypothetical protein